MNCKIVGGGVQGLSTGILLEYLGHKTEIITKNVPYVDGDDIPTVATDYAAASIYPVKIESNYSEDELIRFAERTFKPFFETSGIPVRKQTHYYLYEDEKHISLPDRMNVVSVSDYEGDLPHRPENEVSSGYVCDEYFVEMPVYVPLLYETYRSLGGSISKQEVSKDDVNRLLDSNIVFNCSGYGSKILFNDDSMRAVKGHIVETACDQDTPLDFAYTYTPSDYGHYTYMYPRDGSVIFGGTYLEGDIIDGKWEGEEPTDPINRDGERIPERVYEVNKSIMNSFADVAVDDVSVKYGFRPYREAGMRVEQDDSGVIHNYGHGGAGVSMSWWSAINAVSNIDTVSESVLTDVSTKMAQVNKKRALDA